MNKVLKSFIWIVPAILLVVGAFLFVRSVNDNRLINETKLRVESELKLVSLINENKVIQHKNDSIKIRIDSLSSVIKIQNNNPKVIYKYYEKEHSYVNSINAVDAINLFSNNAIYYQNNRERFNGSRFVK
jgi:hypothetical protein